MGKTVEIPIKMNSVVFWSAEFDNSKRHCWPDREGVNRLEGNWDTICKGGHAPILAGNVEWIRFIRTVNSITREENNISTEDNDTDLSDIGGFGSPTQLGRHMHSGDGKHWPACEIYPDWIVFLDNKNSVAYIELHNEDLIWIANEAYDEVKVSYGR